VDWKVRTARPLVKPPLFKAPRLLTEGVIAVSRWNEAARVIILFILIDLVNFVENEALKTDALWSCSLQIRERARIRCGILRFLREKPFYFQEFCKRILR
jgi:hypothetical protein